MRFKLPTSFELYGQTIKVTVQSQDYFESNCTYGCWDPTELEISIREGLSKEVLPHTFWHEFLHAALEAVGHGKDSSDEQFVDSLAGLIAQALKSMKHD